MTSKELLHYIEPTLKDGFFDTVVINVSVNLLLKDKHILSLDELVTNLKNIVFNYFLFGITKVYISGIVANNEMSVLLLESITFAKKLGFFCNKVEFEEKIMFCSRDI